MTERVGFGAAVGAVVSAVAWNANHAPHTVSTFPNGLSLLILATLTFGAVWLHFRHSRPDNAAASLKAGGTIGAATGLVFGMALVGLGAIRFSQPGPMLLAFTFLTAFLSSVACGAVASALLWRGKRSAGAA